MGDTGANTDHWAEFYGVGGAPAAEATVVTTAAAATVSSPTAGAGSPTPSPGIEGGRVGKPARRRSRASRRAPVTLLNTDTSNFRAMVQQFTGIPSSGAYGPAGAGAGGPVISFRTGASSLAPVMRPTPAAVMSFDQQLAAASSHQHQHQPTPTSSLQGQLFRPQPHHHHHHQQQQYGYDSSDMSSSFLHGFDSSSAEDRLLLQSIQQAAQMMPSGRPASTHNTNGYNFG